MVFGALGVGNFDLAIAQFFGEDIPVRITNDATVPMIKNRLSTLFGNDSQFTDERAVKMKEKMMEDLRYGRKEEYMSDVGIIVLFSCSGGKLTAAMTDAILKANTKGPGHHVKFTEICELCKVLVVTNKTS